MDEAGVALVTVTGKSGELTVQARAFVDATEKAILWQLAGAQVELVDGPSRSVVFLNGVEDLALTGTITACLEDSRTRWYAQKVERLPE